jgi:hypothetical protein
LGVVFTVAVIVKASGCENSYLSGLLSQTPDIVRISRGWRFLGESLEYSLKLAASTMIASLNKS